MKIGSFVKVEADRGEDLGKIVGKISVEKFNSTVKRPENRSAGSSGSADHVFAR